jgi:endonuclease/exonuclease/phosphatase family metal-dependent hydrolase
MISTKKKKGLISRILQVASCVLLVSLLLSYLTPFVHPSTIRILPFFGLAYPIILLLNIIMLAYWIFMRSRLTWFLIAGLLIGGKLHFRMIATGSDASKLPTRDKILHVMSYNVRLFDLYTASTDQKYTRRNAIFAYLREQNPDIICFQEFYHQDKPTSFSTRDTLIQLLDIKDYHERYAHKLAGRQNFGVAVLSKYPLIAKGDVMFETQGQNDFNYCIFVDIIKNNDTFRVYNVHLQSIKLQQDDYSVFDKSASKGNTEKPSTIRLLMEKLTVAYPKRAEQARAVIEHMQTSPYPTIVCGDFNDTPLSYAYNQFNRFLTDAFRECSSGIGSTYVGRVPAGRIDYIFHSSDLTSSHFTIQKEALSDHRAISCKIFKTPQP